MIGDKIYAVIEDAGVVTIYGLIGMKQYYDTKKRAVKIYIDSTFYATKTK